MSEVSVVITSFDRWELLRDTIDSFRATNTYPIDKFIVIDDSDNKEFHTTLRHQYPDITVISEGHRGQVECIDKAYSLVTTPYVFHTEDDFNYVRPAFIEKSLAVLKHDPRIMQVSIRYREDLGNYPILPEVYTTTDGVQYQILGDYDWWHGFSFQCGLRLMEAYNKVRPYTQWSAPDKFITIRECLIGEAYYKIDYKVAILMDGYV